jgi:hypothetical protein
VADVLSHTVSLVGLTTFTVAHVQVAGKVVDSQNQSTVIKDDTGPNALNVYFFVPGWTNAMMSAFVHENAVRFLMIDAGVAPPPS